MTRAGKNRVWLFADVVKCGFKFGAGYKDYSLLEFYNSERCAARHLL